MNVQMMEKIYKLSVRLDNLRQKFFFSNYLLLTDLLIVIERFYLSLF